MEFSTQFDVVGPVLQIVLIDLLLSGDNAILIALACRGLPEAVRPRAVFLGTGAAVLFRVILTFAASLALRAPYLKLIGAVLLLLIAIELLARNSAGRPTPSGRSSTQDLWRAVTMIVAADAVMSLDNVVAVAAAAQDNLLYLFLGLVLSIPILIFSSLFVARLLDAHPALIQAGAALLGWIAGRTAVSDPAIASTLEGQSFGLVALAPVLGALYVLIQGGRLREGRATAGPAARTLPTPPRTPEPNPAPAPAARIEPVVPAPDAVILAAATSQAGPQEPPDGSPRRRFEPMDIAILGGVAVPLLGLLLMLVYFLFRAVGVF